MFGNDTMQSKVNIMYDGNKGTCVKHEIADCFSPIFYLKTQLDSTFTICFACI